MIWILSMQSAAIIVLFWAVFKHGCKLFEHYNRLNNIIITQQRSSGCVDDRLKVFDQKTEKAAEEMAQLMGYIDQLKSDTNKEIESLRTVINFKRHVIK